MRGVRRHRKGLRLFAAAALFGAQLTIPVIGLAAPAEGGELTVSPGSEPEKYLPGTQALVDMIKSSEIGGWYTQQGTYELDPGAVAAAIEADARANRGWDPKHRITKVYSIVSEDRDIFGVRYKTNQNFGIVRGVEYMEIVVRNPDTGEIGVGGMFWVDPLFALKMPDIDPTWRTAVGGAAAVAAAAAALAAAAAGGAGAAGAAAGAGASGGQGGDPKRPVGHVLQLNSRRIDVTMTKSALLEASVWTVRADASYEPAYDCEVILHIPERFSASVDRGQQSVSAVISQEEGAPARSAIAVYVNGPASGTTEHVEIVAEVPASIQWRVEPNDRGLVPNGRDKVTLIAMVQPSPSQQAAGMDVAAASANLTFAALGEWGEVSEPVPWEGGARAVSVIARSPQPDRQLAPPESIEVDLSVTLGEVTLTERAHVLCAGLPELEVQPEELEFAEGCGMAFDLKTTVKNHAGVEWSFEADWKEQHPSLGAVTCVDTFPERTTVRIKEAPPEKANPDNPKTTSRLTIKATAEGFDDLEREILVSSLREGLYPDTINADPATGRFRVAADGSGKPTDIGFRVYVADPATGRIVTKPELAKGLEFVENEDEGTPEANMLAFAAMAPSFVTTRDTGSGPTGVYRFKTDKKIPGRTPLTDVAYWVSVPGMDAEKFGYDLHIGLLTPASAPGSPAWNLEYERASKIINEFCPPAYRDKLRNTLETRGKQLGAEGLAEMRKRIWFISADLVLAEGAAGYEAEAAWADRIATVLDWASYMGDICFGIVIGMYTGPYTAFAAQTLKPMMISAIIAYREGQSAEAWLNDQLWTVVGIFEGKVIDPDNFAKLTGGNKAKAWALYVSYQFFKEYAYNGKSFVEACKSVAWNVSEEVFVGWLGEKARANGVPQDPAKPGDNTIRDGADPTRPVDPTKPTGPAKPGEPAKPAEPADGGRPQPTEPGRPADGAEGPAKTPKPPETDAETPIGTKRPKPGETPGPSTPKPGEPGPAKPGETEGPAPEAGEPPKREKKGPPDPDKKPKPAEKPPEVSGDAKKLRETATTGADGKKYADKATTLEIMRDPSRVRQLKNAPPDVQEAFENTRRQIYDAHDAKVVQAAKGAPGMAGKNLKVLEFRTPGQTGPSLNTDRDFRVCYESTDPNTGKQVWIEVPRKHWENTSLESFAKQTGGPQPAKPGQPTDAEVEAMRHWSEAHQQLGTDKAHVEASLDFTDQGYTVGADGKLAKTQVTPNIELVKQGKAKLIDPDGLGHMYEQKVRDAMEHGHQSEAYSQAKKAVEQLDGVRDGYDKQGYRVGNLTPEMRVGMQAVREAAARPGDMKAVADAEATLRSQGYSGLSDFMTKVHSQFGSLQIARK